MTRRRRVPASLSARLLHCSNPSHAKIASKSYSSLCGLISAYPACASLTPIPPRPSPTPMYIVVIAWLYVALMMALAESQHPQGGWLGALVTFVLYGLAPVALVVYLLRTPHRRQQRRAAEQAAERTAEPATGSHAGMAANPPAGDAPAAQLPASAAVVPQADGRRHATGAPVAAEREER